MEDAARTYVDIVPRHSLVEEPGKATILVDLSAAGFTKEQLKVQVDNHGMLRISGERLLAGNQWSRFRKVLPIPEGCNVDGIRSRFEKDGVLHITMPRLSTAAEEPNAEVAEMGGSDAGQDQNAGHSTAQQNGAAAAEAEEGSGK